MKKITLGLFTAAVFIAGTFISANSAFAVGGVKIAVINSQEVMANADATKRAVEIMKAETAKAQKRIEELEAAIRSQIGELKNKKALLSADKYMDEEMSLRSRAREVNTEKQTLRERLSRKNQKLRQEISIIAKAAVAAVAKQNGYDIVMDKNMLHYSSETIDITSAVLKLVNSKTNK